VRALSNEPKYRAEDGILYVAGESRRYHRRKVFEKRGNKLVHIEPSDGDEVRFHKPIFALEEVLGLRVGQDNRQLYGKAALLSDGYLSIIGNDSHKCRDINFTLSPPWGGWPAWSVTGIGFYGERGKWSEPIWDLVAQIPSASFEELTAAYRRGTLADLRFSIISELWEVYDPPYFLEEIWCVAPDDMSDEIRSDSVGKLPSFNWMEKESEKKSEESSSKPVSPA
jgi:hypothetical protein